ncbi:peptidoglycan bridge formation glycyltransferase FemA/FemB family protein [Candidatus Roizmanbacteria bacterium]|nr:peptidoglycan bridge formation glycyltransferase FemA/FemB family protein [Candidatus Roizmanbacteria bacterium]
MNNHPLQSESWEKARKQMGVETRRIDDFLLTLHKIPLINYKIGYLPRSQMPNKQTLKKLYEFGEVNHVIFIKIEPYEEKSKLQFKSKYLVQSNHPLFPAWTQVLDLNKSEDELLKSFHPKTRYNIRLAEKKGVVIKEESNNKGFETFARLYFETTKRQKYFGHDYKYHKTIWENLKNKISHILTAYYQNIPLASYQLFYLDGTFYYVYGGTSNQYRNLMASNLLMWEAIKLGKKLGAKKFDMWGSLPPDYDQSHAWSGFTRFKQGYGTKFVEMVGSYDLVINPFFYKIYNFIYVLREFALKLKRQIT